MAANRLKHIMKILLALSLVFALCAQTALAVGTGASEDDLASVESSGDTGNGDGGSEPPASGDDSGSEGGSSSEPPSGDGNSSGEIGNEDGGSEPPASGNSSGTEGSGSSEPHPSEDGNSSGDTGNGDGGSEPPVGGDSSGAEGGGSSEPPPSGDGDSSGDAGNGDGGSEPPASGDSSGTEGGSSPEPPSGDGDSSGETGNGNGGSEPPVSGDSSDAGDDGSSETPPSGDGDSSGDTEGGGGGSEPPAQEDTVIPATDLDIEDLDTPMTVGTSQLLSVTIIPTDSTETRITYTSLTPDIATVNALGRIRAVAPGTAKIQVAVGNVTKTLSVKVVESEDGKVIPATGIDPGDIVSPMIIGTSQLLSVTVLPTNSTETDVKYQSLTPAIASVNEIGRIQALAYGTAKIKVTVGSVSQTISIKTEYEESEEEDYYVPARAVDVDFEEQMTVGTTQTLNTSLLPVDATSEISYKSGNESVATVNQFGKIVAVSLGTAKITIRSGFAEKVIEIQVKEKIEPRDIDFEPPGPEITIGQSVTLGATILPTNVEDQTITYSSTDETILSVNEIGRIRALSPGTATIYMRTGSIERSVTLTAVNEIVVTAIDISEFKEKMKVDDQQTLSATAHPTDAKDQKITYASTNETVATVSIGGVITAKQKGETTIIVKAGAVEKKLDLTVYIATEEIHVPETYVIMQPGDTYSIYATVSPSDADQNVSYRSTNDSIVTADSSGKIKALAVGRASVVLSNDDGMKAITIIVNDGSRNSVDNPSSEGDQPGVSTLTDEIASIILEIEDGETVSVMGDDCPFANKDILAALYQKPKSLRIAFDEYSLIIHGKDIRNANNSFSTDISLTKTDTGVSFSVGKESNLPGAIEVELVDVDPSLRYLYLFNDASQKYERLNSFDGKTVKASMTGTYLLTATKLRQENLPGYVALAFGVLVLGFAGMYIVVKKKHWFW